MAHSTARVKWIIGAVHWFKNRRSDVQSETRRRMGGNDDHSRIRIDEPSSATRAQSRDGTVQGTEGGGKEQRTCRPAEDEEERAVWGCARDVPVSEIMCRWQASCCDAFLRMQFDAYPSPPSFSDASSTPRTPSPNESDFLHPSHINPKHNIPIGSVPHIFQESDLMIHHDPTWFPYTPQPNSLLQELYEQDPHDSYPQDIYIDDTAHYTEWHNHQQQHILPHAVPRRATFPYVRHDLPQPQYYDQYAVYSDPISDRADPQPIKLEDTPLIVPSQLGFPAHLQTHHHHPSFLPSPAGAAVPVQLTDDAASKETQYLRRRCFNCHTTEPPSWRRSTLNPGKIVCNKCGLYERTHLRPRPLRFDELRAGGKTRKATGNNPADKKNSKSAPVVSVKNEPTELGLTRRNSVSSNASSGASDWDDSISICSSQPATPGSASSSAFSSPAVSTFPIPRSSQSPPVDSGLQAPIRLPNAPLTDIASLQQSHPAPRKAASTPNYYPQPAMYQGQSDSFRRGSLPVQRNVQFTSPPMPSQSLTPDASLQASPLPHASPLLLSSPSIVDLPSA
ncbi:hypothetical protein OG21DRAFT_1519511 [Imleria badia]|nr:hypothetical protein OG21DRAFT_1519511 [Imleria badia]